MFPRCGEEIEDCIARQNRCEYQFDDQDELAAFFERLSSRMRDALSPYATRWQHPPMMGTNAFRAMIADLNWLDKALDYLILVAAKHGLKVEPFQYFRRLIHGELARDSDRCREIVDATEVIHIRLLGRAGHYVFVWDREVDEVDNADTLPGPAASVNVEQQTEEASLPPCTVTLSQMAGIVSRSKSAIEKLKGKDLPPPDIKGGTGQPDEWEWDTVRPILEKKFGRNLPNEFPADRLNR